MARLLQRKEITWAAVHRRICRQQHEGSCARIDNPFFPKDRMETDMNVIDFRFRPNTPEPEEGWMGELASELVRLGRSIEEADDLPPLPAPPAWTESKQRHREALKKLALGQKLSRGQSWQQTMW